MYASPDGTEMVRQCATWEEAHALAIEIEDDNSATKALTNPNFYNEHYTHAVSYGEAKDKQSKSDGKAAGKSDRPKGVCFDKLRTGKCERENCKYSHDKTAIAAAKEEKGAKGATVAAVDASDPDWTAKAYQKGAGKKGKKGKDGKGKWPGKGAQDQSMKHILCKYIKKGETCPARGAGLSVFS